MEALIAASALLLVRNSLPDSIFDSEFGEWAHAGLRLAYSVFLGSFLSFVESQWL